jgi:hypothetical protein
MGVALEIFNLIIGILWCYVVSAYRLVIPVPRKKINGEIVLITGICTAGEHTLLSFHHQSIDDFLNDLIPRWSIRLYDRKVTCDVIIEKRYILYPFYIRRFKIEFCLM